MSAPTTAPGLRERLDTVEQELAGMRAAVLRNDERLRALEAPPVTVRRHAPELLPVVEVRPLRPPRARPDAASLSDFLGGRALAWLGGVATLGGIVLLLALAISHGWIGREVRIGLAAAASAALMAAGSWLHARRGRTEAAVTMVGAATAGAFATLVVAGQVYALIPALPAVIGAMLVGALATALAVRWAGRMVAALGLIGGLVSPVLVGAPHDAATLTVLAAGVTCATCVVLWRRWGWLALATVLVSAPQWARWMIDGHGTLADLTVLVVFGSLGLVGAVFASLRRPSGRPARAAAALLVLNALILGVAGRLALGATGEVWLAGMAVAHAAIAVWRRPVIAVDDGLRRLLLAVSVVVADVAFALVLHGVAQAAAWGAGALAFGWLVRRAGADRVDAMWLQAGLGLHVALVIMRTLFELPPAALGHGPGPAALACAAILAAICVSSARLAGGERSSWRAVLDGVGLLAIAYLTAAALDGAALVAAWAAEAAALAEISTHTEDRVARTGALAFLTAATLHTAIWEVGPTALIDGVANLGGAALAVGATAAAALRMGLSTERESRLRLAMLAGAGLAPLVLGSVAITTAFQPAAAAQDLALLDLGVRQQGQVLLSALWGVAGVAGLIAGLRRNLMALRMGALALLLATVAKVFLYDLSALTSIYRVMSFFVVGGLLLGGAFAYQRLRPPPRAGHADGASQPALAIAR